MSTLLRAEHLVRRLEAEVPVTLVDDVSLQIETGEFVCIMGPSGSGKSSLLYLLGLLDVPTSGRVWLEDGDTSLRSDDELARLRLRKLGFVFQFHFLLAEFTTLQNVMLPMRRLGVLDERQRRDRALDLLSRFGMDKHSGKYPSQLSGGERQRVAIARALANDPVLILADEPTGNLDSAASGKVRALFHDLARKLGKSVVAVTHDSSFAAVADRRVGLVDGKLDASWRAGG